jgi:hypothetical protein
LETVAGGGEIKVTAAWHGAVDGSTGNGPITIDAKTGADRQATPGAAPSVVNGYAGIARNPKDRVLLANMHVVPPFALVVNARRDTKHPARRPALLGQSPSLSGQSPHGNAERCNAIVDVGWCVRGVSQDESWGDATARAAPVAASPAPHRACQCRRPQAAARLARSCSVHEAIRPDRRGATAAAKVVGAATIAGGTRDFSSFLRRKGRPMKSARGTTARRDVPSLRRERRRCVPCRLAKAVHRRIWTSVGRGI